tara:strand:- start:3305 stop:3481 length:177 start_codon:yes stop_codon:yes gene_type:complete
MLPRSTIDPFDWLAYQLHWQMHPISLIGWVFKGLAAYYSPSLSLQYAITTDVADVILL